MSKWGCSRGWISISDMASTRISRSMLLFIMTSQPSATRARECLITQSARQDFLLFFPSRLTYVIHALAQLSRKETQLSRFQIKGFLNRGTRVFVVKNNQSRLFWMRTKNKRQGRRQNNAFDASCESLALRQMTCVESLLDRVKENKPTLTHHPPVHSLTHPVLLFTNNHRLVSLAYSHSLHSLPLSNSIRSRYIVPSISTNHKNPFSLHSSIRHILFLPLLLSLPSLHTSLRLRFSTTADKTDTNPQRWNASRERSFPSPLPPDRNH